MAVSETCLATYPRRESPCETLLSPLGEPVGKVWAQFLSPQIPDSFSPTIPQLRTPSPMSPIAAAFSLLGGGEPPYHIFRAAFLDHPV